MVDLLGKPIDDSTALCIPAAIYAFPGGAVSAWRLIAGRAASPLCELGWKSLGVLELTALPSIERTHGTTAVEEVDALLVGGGDPLYLSSWIRRSGLIDLLPSLRETVWVGVSAGSLVMAPDVGQEFVYPDRPTDGDRALGPVEFAMFPHLDHEAMPDHSMRHAERWAAGLPVPGYAIDDETAIKVVGDTVEVVSEGSWKLFSSRPVVTMGGLPGAGAGRHALGRAATDALRHVGGARRQRLSPPSHVRPARPGLPRASRSPPAAGCR